MTDPAFAAAMAFLRPHEGGYQCDKNDPGNWTGGVCGEGLCKGTNCGISAASYPDYDIQHLTGGQIDAIYLADFWLPNRFTLLQAPFSAKVFDESVNMGPHNGGRGHEHAIGLFQHACNCCGADLEEDGVLGGITAAAANRFANTNEAGLKSAYVSALHGYYESLVQLRPGMSGFLKDWLARAADWP